ncbi:MAG: Gfo/Idh/MocA family protein [Armatimonadota bacterium]
MEELSRRRFISGSALSAGALWMAAGNQALGQSANEKLNIGIIGTNNRALANIDGVQSQNITAICDIDDEYIAVAKKRFPNAVVYTDYRKLVEQKGLDAVVISTPDHNHAPATAFALNHNLHVYCEKPLTHTVEEARKIAELTKKKKRVTQMGTQIHAEPNYRRVVELIRSGAIGNVLEVHTRVGKSWSGRELEPYNDGTPENMHWDEWLGPCAVAPYHPVFHPARWRGYWAYGNGTLGDMGCHHLDLVFWALDLRHPTRVAASGPAAHPQFAPEGVKVEYDFPARGSQPPVKVTWYDGNMAGDAFKKAGAQSWGDGSLFIGDKGMLLADYGRYKLLPEDKYSGFVPPAKSIPDSIGHYEEWMQAIRNGGPTTCNFDYAGALTETVLLGTVAYRTGEAIEWDARKLKTNNERANALLRKEYRKGWKV